ncbi:Integrator complex subunit 10 [Holothuria leucospilota]|uniref:Integrator complex subunit 10 n=1 Tax=Holothuria leucospilota TaxID=206669 RepID=A0A9Q0YD66_HOLLE|nr:Integrator complex subunit 10 [Holothuria leucospilota]
MAAPMEMDNNVVEKKNPIFDKSSQHHSSSDARSIIEKAKLCQKDDPYAAKSLLLMAKTLYPTEFCVQFEAYIVEKSGQSTTETAQSLIQLFSRFKEEVRLHEELFILTSSLQKEAEIENKFYRDLFEKIPEPYQKSILLFCCEESKDKHEKCKVQLLLMKKFPAFIREYGLSLVDSLLELDKVSGGRLPRNKFRQLLVTEVLPIILESEDLEFNPKHISKWLYVSIEFYISVAIQPKLQLSTNSDILKSPTNGKAAGGSMSEAGDSSNGDRPTEIISDITSPWERLHTLFLTIAKRSGWNLDCIPSESMAFLESFTSLSSVHQSCQPEDIGTLKSIFYSATILFFRSMYTYFNLINPGIFGGE